MKAKKLKKKEVKNLLSLASAAGEKIMRVYETSFKIEQKEDSSPLTLADRLSHNLLVSGLKKFFPGIPVLSEEGAAIPFGEREKWDYFWLVDPLDGTKEFISKNGEFTVNIALIYKKRPIFGLISLPVKDIIYYASADAGAYKIENKGEALKIKVPETPSDPLIVARSRSHSIILEEKIIAKLGKTENLYAGSALKFCLVAEGKADIYLRSGPTMEWDTAAGHCIALAAGAVLKQLDGNDLCYNKRSPVNPGFICAGESLLEKLKI